MPADSHTRVEVWKLRGLIAAECGACHATGIEIRISVPVELSLNAQEPDAEDPALRYTMGMRVVGDSQPVEMECLACGNLVRHGDIAEVTTHGEQHDGTAARTEANGA